MTRYTLKNCTVFAIDRENIHASVSCPSHDDITGDDQGLFICKCDMLPRIYSLQGRHQTGCTDHCRNDQIHRLMGGGPAVALLAPHDIEALLFRYEFFQPRSSVGIQNYRDLRMELTDLLCQQLDIVTGSQRFYGELFR